MDAPTWDEIKGWTELEDLLGASDPKGTRLVAVANSTLKRITGISWESVDEDDVPLVEHAVQGLTEQLAIQGREEIVETLSDFDLIQSFSAGPYSETRRSPGDAFKARMLNAWPWLNQLLWGLLTPDKYDYWIAFFGGKNAPAFAVTEVDWKADPEWPYSSVDDPYGEPPHYLTGRDA